MPFVNTNNFQITHQLFPVKKVQNEKTKLDLPLKSYSWSKGSDTSGLLRRYFKTEISLSVIDFHMGKGGGCNNGETIPDIWWCKFWRTHATTYVGQNRQQGGEEGKNSRQILLLIS